MNIKKREENAVPPALRGYTQFELSQWVDTIEKWQDLTTAIKVERTRIIEGKRTHETIWYVSSVDINAPLAAKSILSYWEVENPLH